MSLLFHCAECQRPLNVGDQFAGQPGVCPACQKTIQVPESSEIPMEEFRDRLNRWRSTQTAGTTVTAVKQKTGKAKQKIDPGEVKIDAPEAVAEKVDSASIKTESEQVATKLSKKLPRLKSGAASIDSRFADSAEPPPIEPQNESPLADESDSAVWYVRPPGGGQFGPASVDLINQWVEEGRVTPDSYVWREGWEDWKIASSAISNFEDLPFDVVPEGNSDNAAATAARTAYLQAKKRRTMQGVTVLIGGTVVVVALLIVLFFVIKR